MNRHLVCLASLGVALCLAGCSSSSTRITSTGPAPTVTAVGAQTNGVATNRSIDVMFSADMDPSTINTSTFLLARASDRKSITGTVLYAAGSKSASFKPAADLDPVTAYSATITTGAADTAGHHLAANYNFTFTTRATDDKSPIAVYQTIPSNGATGVDVNGKIQVIFTEGADPNSVTLSGFVVRDKSGTLVDGAVTYDIYTNVAAFYPKAPLAPGMIYTVTISGIRDLAGVVMTSPYVFSFTTAGTTGPTADLVYQAVQSGNQLYGWTFDAAAGTLTPASGSPASPTGIGPYQLLPSADRRFLYVVMSADLPGVRGNNCLEFTSDLDVFSVDHATGALTLLQGLPLHGTCAGQGAIDPTGQFLYIPEMAQYGGSGFIDVVHIDTATGMMSMVSGSPFASSSTVFPGALVATGGYVYATNGYSGVTNGVLIYQRDASSGSLLYASGVPIGPQGPISLLPSGNTLYTVDASGAITQFAVDSSTGDLTQQSTTPSSATPFEVEADPTGHYLAVAALGGVYLYNVSASGGLTPVAGSPFTTTNSPRTAMFDTTGSYFAVGSYGGTSMLDIYRLNSSTVTHVTSAALSNFPGRVTMFTK